MITATPARQMAAPRKSQRSGRNLSTTTPQASEPATKTPPYAARMRPKCGSGWKRGDEAVRAEREHAGGDPPQAAVLAPALPDQPRAADLGQRREDEQRRASGRRCTRVVNGSGQSGVAAQMARSSQPASTAARSVSRTAVRSASAASTLGQLGGGAAGEPGGPARRGEQLGDLVEGEAEPLRGLDHPQHGDRVRRVDAVPAERALRLGEQAAALVVAQGLRVHAGGARRAARERSPGHARPATRRALPRARARP